MFSSFKALSKTAKTGWISRVPAQVLKRPFLTALSKTAKTGWSGKRGQEPFAGTARRVLRTKGS
jgi:hypothetical protein